MADADTDKAKDPDKGKPPKPYKLNVQGVTIDSATPTIVVREAMTLAGFDVTQPWIIILRLKGEPKRPVELDTVIDLTDPGVEKLRLTPKQISNGEARPRRRDFDLLPADAAYLDAAGHHWETVCEGGVRWLLIHGYPAPQGYGQAHFTLALQIPLTYPASQIDMFYCLPHLTLVSGRAIPQTECRVPCGGEAYQRWSRHREDGAWNRHTDNVVSHLALVDESLLREVEP
jgi:hypothetical protein